MGSILLLVVPPGSEFDDVNFGIKTLCKELECSVVDISLKEKGQRPKESYDELLASIIGASFAIIDITNVDSWSAYILGCCNMLTKEVLLIAKEQVLLPLPFTDLQVIDYEEGTSARQIIKTLRQPIKELVSRSLHRPHLTEGLSTILRTLLTRKNNGHLYGKITELRLRDIIEEVEAWMNGKIDVGPREAIRKGIEIFRNLREGGFATFLAPISGYWRVNREYLEEGRKAADEGGKKIERVYILPTYKALFSKDLKDLLIEDQSSKVRTYLAFADTLPQDANRDFGIWDNEVLCLIDTVETAQHRLEVRGGQFTKLPGDLEKAKIWKREILNASLNGEHIVHALSNLSEDQKLLCNSISEMEKNSALYCKGGYLDKKDCSWYHSSWQYLRLIDMVSTPFWHKKFYKKTLSKEIGANGARKILISGTADYAILQMINQAIPKTVPPEEYDIVVCDVCNTPLEICRWYATQYMSSIKLNYLLRNVQQIKFQEREFDIIITDAFLTRFRKKERLAIIEEWERVLAPGGAIVTTIRLDSEHGGKALKNSTEDIKHFVEKAKRKLVENGVLLRPIEDKIVAKARLYAENIISYPLKNPAEVEKLLSSFDVEIIRANTPGETKHPTLYAQVIARKGKAASEKKDTAVIPE